MCKTQDIPKITHVIFDLDGLLIDTEPIYTKAISDTMAAFGKKFSLKLKAKTMGMKHDVAVEYMLKDAGLAGIVSVEEFSEFYDRRLGELLPNNSILPGAMRLVKHLAAHNVPLAICTGSNSFEYPLKVQNHKELLDLIPLRVLTGDDPAVKHGKPAPDGFLVTMSRFEQQPASPSNVLVFEDAPNGVLAAVAAGMQVIMVPDWSFSSPPESVHDKILLVLNSLEEFKPETVGLPPFNDAM